MSSPKIQFTAALPDHPGGGPCKLTDGATKALLLPSQGLTQLNSVYRASRTTLLSPEQVRRSWLASTSSGL